MDICSSASGTLWCVPHLCHPSVLCSFPPEGIHCCVQPGAWGAGRCTKVLCCVRAVSTSPYHGIQMTTFQQFHNKFGGNKLWITYYRNWTTALDIWFCKEKCIIHILKHSLEVLMVVISRTDLADRKEHRIRFFINKNLAGNTRILQYHQNHHHYWGAYARGM